MNVALILAGGVDPRFQMAIPKQFVIVENRPIIVYTLQVFQNHPQIDKIIVSCLHGWKEMVQAYAKQFDITKMAEIVEGGRDAQESIRKGIQWIKENGRGDDLVVIHDAIRPLVTDGLISDSIKCCREYGMGVAAVRSMDTVMLTEDGLIAVSGKVNLREDRENVLVADSISNLHSVREKLGDSRPVRNGKTVESGLYVRCAKSDMNAVLAITALYPGSIPIKIAVEGKVFRAGAGFNVSDSQEMIQKLNDRFGSENVKLVR